MLIVNAHNVTENLTNLDGTSDYEVWVGINRKSIWTGSIKGHVRRQGAAKLLRLIADAMEKLPRSLPSLGPFLPGADD